MNNPTKQKVDMVFRRWSRRNWASFASLGKVVKITTLSVAIIGGSLSQKAEAQTNITIQPDSSEQLDPVEIIDLIPAELMSESGRMVTVITAGQIDRSPYQSLNDLLASLSILDLRQRGPSDVQADISIRGSHFDQVLILINGIPFNNSQTGHHNLDLPFSLEEVERVEVLTGAASRIYGSEAFSGAVNFITRKPVASQIALKVSGGSFQTGAGNLSFSYKNQNINHLLSLSSTGSAGHQPNTDFQNSTAYYRLGTKIGNSTLEWQNMLGLKAFGANSFYTPKYPEQFEKTYKALSSISLKGGQKNFFFDIKTFVQSHTDRFELFRIEENAPSWYLNPNFHRTFSIGLRADLSYFSKFGKTNFGFSSTYSGINSNVLGETTGDTIKPIIMSDGFFTKADNRTVLNSYVEHILNWRQWRIAGGMLLSKPFYADQKLLILPGIDLRYALSSRMAIYSSFNMSSRLPTFTDLYYQGPANLGNRELEPEKSYQAEMGLKYKNRNLQSTITFFYIQGINTIDWVRPSDTVKWQPQNLGRTSTTGMEMTSRYRFADNRFIKEISLDFLWQFSQKTADNLQLLYSDDFIRQKVGLGAQHSFTQNLLLSWNVRYINRNGIFYLYDSQTKSETPNPFGDHFEADLKLSYQLKNWNIYLIVNNLTNSRYFDISNIQAPGRWFMVGFSTRITEK